MGDMRTETQNQPDASEGTDVGTSAKPEVETLSIPDGGHRLFARFRKPRGRAPYPTVIVSHGFGSSYSYMEGYAQSLSAHGYAALTFDFVGGGVGSRSGGSTTQMSVLTEARDLNAVMDAMLRRSDVDSSRLYLMGASQGGFVSTYVAAHRPKDVRALVNFYPAYVIQDDARKRGNGDQADSVMGVPIGPIYGRDALSFDIYREMPKYTGDVLIIHGTADPIVPISYSERAARTFPHARLIRIPGAGHGFSGEDDDRAIRDMLGFLDRENR